VGIEVRDLRFAYADEPVLDQLNLAIAPGEKVAIVGASGGGKSTLVQLLLGLYSAQAGTIRFGVPACRKSASKPCARTLRWCCSTHPCSTTACAPT
jgi:ABC-type bacteriocin/lantibiotic exporters, contain an N-terminal double-glycine peptidase domain